ncbi:MAG: class I SAM-dependent methyltransferase [Roseomonas sp.]|nr:class I SAM-dependent methyltransferase [Roseomonas sp.]MCA3430164.1 class I SAM-dependent methyltransferase [Roseomonas sp.]MCA3433383.1 class I SAM-dependent methyltransferase [Roseomonas sp.]
MGSGVSKNDVEAAYRLILGRSPESEAAIKAQLVHPDVVSLHRAFLSSEEFQSKRAGTSPQVGASPLNGVTLPPLDIEVSTSDETLEQMVVKTADYWNRIGSEAPHWSVLTDNRYSPENIVVNRESFFETSKLDQELIIASLARAGFQPENFRCCVEFGCGVGRLTFRLASLFSSVTGLDISVPHLKLAQEYCSRLRLTNVNFGQVSKENLMPASGFDFWFSRIVLQHNPPPVAMEILRRVFRLLPLGGVAMFQVPVYHTGYRFSSETYLQSSLGEDMEMHCLPQKAIFDEAELFGMRLVDIREDTWIVGPPSEWVSNNFVFLKDRPSRD